MRRVIAFTAAAMIATFPALAQPDSSLGVTEGQILGCLVEYDLNDHYGTLAPTKGWSVSVNNKVPAIPCGAIDAQAWPTRPNH